MARQARLCIAGQVHLVIQRARVGELVLADAADDALYLAHLREAALASRCALHGFALTPAQMLLLVTPSEPRALGSMLQAAGRRFVAAYNRRHGRTGALWDGRFGATVVEPETHLIECLRFVEAAPVRLGLAEQASDWMWSSAQHHTGRRALPGLTEHPVLWALGNTPFEREMAYGHLLEQPLAESRVRSLESAALQGWVVGSPGFAQAMGRLAKRRVSPARRGRPPLQEAKT